MLSKLISGALVGLSAVPVEVEVDVASQGLPSITIVGLASKAVDEAKERVRAALRNSGTDFPARRITINLAPADLPKDGPCYDMPIALGLLVASGQMELRLDKKLFFGELSLDGSFRHTRGALPFTLMAKKLGIQEVFVPSDNAQEATIVKGVTVYPVKTLEDLVAHLNGMKLIEPLTYKRLDTFIESAETEFDFSEIVGQEFAKRALEIAAAGGHNVLLSGTPGAGKTMMARAFPSILPMLTEEESIEVTQIYSVSGMLTPGKSLISVRPFRSPHHTTSKIGLIGGGSRPLPGEISLAHRGVLFLDEFPEFPRNVVESLRQPMEDGSVHISRASGTMSFPARFTLIAASNPCPCGNLGSQKKECTCHPAQIQRYQKKLSGPILDRIDLHVEVAEVPIEKLAGAPSAEASSSVRDRVEQARKFQGKRYGDGITVNASLSTRNVKQYCILETEAQQMLTKAANSMNLSARAYNKVIKIARTIADLEGEFETIAKRHIAEAIQYRPRMGQV